MKFTFSWLKDHLETSKNAEDIAEALVRLGVEVESLTDAGALLRPFIIAEITKADQHPDAERLKVCDVNLGTSKTSVVCGGINARAGIKVVFANLGLTIPKNGMVLKPTKIRGVESAGMLCSSEELLLEDDLPAGSIIELPSEAPVGTSYADYLGLNDFIFDVSITPNRTDVLGVRGIARDLANAGYGTLKPLSFSYPKATIDNTVRLSSKLEDSKTCPLFLGSLIKGVKNGPSPKWLQTRLKAIGLRPISALVDITNYLTFDLARPLHVFDAQKLKGDLFLRLSEKGETFIGLDQKTYTLDEGMIVICDDTGVISLAGIMGGISTGCDENTKDVYLECALFDPIRTAVTGRKLGIVTDARYRFERGVDSAFTMDGLMAAQSMIVDLCGGEVSKPGITGKLIQDNRQSVPFLPQDFKALTGVALSEDAIMDLLERMNYGLAIDDKTGIWYITPPTYVHAVNTTEAVIGEMLRVYGFDHVSETHLEPIHGVQENDPFHNVIRRMLCARGLYETVHFAFTDEAGDKFFDGKQVKIDNPISALYTFMRPSLLPSLLEAAAKSEAKGFDDSALFESSDVYHGFEMAEQRPMLAGLRKGFKNGRHFTEAQKKVTLYDAKADMMAVLNHYGLAEESVMFDTPPAYFHPHRAALVKLGHKDVLGAFGEVHPNILKHYDIKGPVVAFELYMDKMPQKKKAKKALSLFHFQPLKRDFAFIVPKTSKAKDLLKALKTVAPDLVERIDIFDVYEGQNIGADKRSIALSLVLQPRVQTLTDHDLKQLHEHVVEAAQKAVNAELRDGHA